MPFTCFGCFGGASVPQEPPRPAPVVAKPVEFTVVEDQHQSEHLLQDVQAALSKAPTDSAEARIAYVTAQVLNHLQAKVVRLYGWTTDDADDAVAGSLVLLSVNWHRRQGPGASAAAAESAKGSARVSGSVLGSNGGGPGVDSVEGPALLPDLPGQRVIVATPEQQEQQQQGGGGSCVPLLQRAVHSKAPTTYTYGPDAAPGPAPADCASDNAKLGARSFVALPLTSGDRLLGILWVGTGGVGAGGGGGGAPLPPAPALRQLATSASMCLVGGAVDPDYLQWLSGSLRRLAAAATLQALVGELCDAASQHVRRRFFIDSMSHAAVVPEPRSTTGFLLDHRPQPGGPGGMARWAAAASRQASLTYNTAGGPPTGGGGLPPRAGMTLASQGVRRSDSFTTAYGGGAGPNSGGGAVTAGGAPSGGGAVTRTPQRTSSHAAMRSGAKRHPTLVEQAAARAATGNCGSPSGPADGQLPSRTSNVVRTSGHAPVADSAAAVAAAAAAGVLPSLRAKGFQLSHTLLQRMVSAVEGRGPDGVYAGLAVADCGRHVQDVHQPSRDVCMLMAGGVRGADLTTDASDSAMFASERSTGRVSMQSLVLVGVDVGGPAAGGAASGPQGLLGEGSLANGGGLGAGAVLAVYLAFPTRLPPLLIGSAHVSLRQLLSVMLARLVRHKVTTDLEAEFQTLCAGVPGSYAVVHSTHGPPPVTRDPPSAFQAAVAAAGAGLLLDVSGYNPTAAAGGGTIGDRTTAGGAGAAGGPCSMVLEPSIGAPVRASSCKMVPLVGYVGAGGVPAAGMSLGASAQLLAAYTDAGCRGGGAANGTAAGTATHGSIGPRGAAGAGLVPQADASGRVFPQTHDGSARPNGPPGPSGAQVMAVCPERIFASHQEGEEEGEEDDEDEDATPTHEEADVMLSSDPRVDEVLSGEGGEGAAGGGTAGATGGRRGGGGAGGDRTAGGRSRGRVGARGGLKGDETDDDDLFPVSIGNLRPPTLPPQPAAVLTVTEADGTSSMRQHMGLLVESLMSTLRSTAQVEDHFDSTVVSARRSMDLELDDLRLSGVLGDGGSGVVLCGMLGTVPVAVKIIQMPEVDQLLLASTVKALGQDPAAPPYISHHNNHYHYHHHHNNNNHPATPNGGGAPASPAAAAAAQNGRGPAQQGANGTAAPNSPQQQKSPPATNPKGGGGGGGEGGAGGGGAIAPVASVSSSKLKQARRDMLRNAMELAVMRSISHVNITTVYAVYDNVILERVKRDSGATAYALRRQGPEDMQMDKTGSKPVFVALCMELCDSGSLASKLEERSFPRLLVEHHPHHEQAGGAAGGRSPGRPRGARMLDMVGIYLTVLEVSCALRYLHARRLIHRDIKSANILLKASPTDPRGWTCKLADFGSALVLDQYLPPEEMPGGGPGSPEGAGEGNGPGRWFAVQEQSWGTITHMSPESMDNNSRVDASSDIFALGIVMWEISSGRGYRPYKELAPEQIGAAVRKGLRPTFTPEVPLAYRTLAQQCWAAEPHKRPSAVQVVQQVKALLSGLQAEGRSHQQHHRSQMQHQQQQPAALPR